MLSSLSLFRQSILLQMVLTVNCMQQCVKNLEMLWRRSEWNLDKLVIYCCVELGNVDVLCHTYSNLVQSLLCSRQLTSAPCNLFRQWLKQKPLFQQVVAACNQLILMFFRQFLQPEGTQQNWSR